MRPSAEIQNNAKSLSQFFILGNVVEGATAALTSAELPENRPCRTIQRAADDAPYFTQIEYLKGP